MVTVTWEFRELGNAMDFAERARLNWKLETVRSGRRVTVVNPSIHDMPSLRTAAVQYDYLSAEYDSTGARRAPMIGGLLWL